MKAEKEIIGLAESNRTFHYFRREDVSFEPFWHFHPEMELTYISKGKGVRYVGDSILPFAENELVLVGENLPHQWVSSVKSVADVIQFRKSDLFKIKEVNQLSELFSKAQKGLIFEKSTSVNAMISDMNHRSRLGRLSGLIEILEELETIPHQELSSDHYLMVHGEGFDKIQRINQFVLENLTRKITIAEVAHEAHMTRESFCRWFKRETGNTFIDFLNLTRIEVFCRLLVEKKHEISAIAYQVGFDSLSQFYRVFKQKKGLCPRQYLKEFDA